MPTSSAIEDWAGANADFLNRYGLGTITEWNSDTVTALVQARAEYFYDGDPNAIQNVCADLRGDFVHSLTLS